MNLVKAGLLLNDELNLRLTFQTVAFQITTRKEVKTLPLSTTLSTKRNCNSPMKQRTATHYSDAQNRRHTGAATLALVS